MNGVFDRYGVTIDGELLDDLTNVIGEYDEDVCLAIPTADDDGCIECYVPGEIATLFKGAMNYTGEMTSGTDDILERSRKIDDWLRKLMTNDKTLKSLGYDDPEDYPEVYLERIGRFEAANGHYDMNFDSDDEEEAHKTAVRKQFPEGYFSFYIRAYEDSNNVTGEWCDPFWNI